MSLISARAMAGLWIFLCASLAPAQDTTLTRLLIAHQHAVQLVGGRLEGPGAQLLIDEGKEARFFLVGEEHGVAELPQVVQALLNELRPAGYNTLRSK